MSRKINVDQELYTRRHELSKEILKTQIIGPSVIAVYVPIDGKVQKIWGA